MAASRPWFRNIPTNPQPCCGFNNHHTMFPPPPHFPFHMGHAPLPHFPFHNNMMNHGPHFPFHENMMNHAPPIFGGGSEWRETADAYVVVVQLPGFHKEEVKVKVEDCGRVLEIRGGKGKEKEEKHENWQHYERSNGCFFKTFSLPENCMTDHIISSMEHGVLTVTVPKKDHVHHHGHNKVSESHHDHGHKVSESHHGHGHKVSESHHGHGHKVSESSHHGHKISESQYHGHVIKKVDVKD